MCLIIDANVASEVRNRSTPRACAVVDWLVDKGGMVVYGGQLTTELHKAGLGGLLLQLSRAGRAFRASDADMAKALKEVKAIGLHCSDDPHVLALARATRSRVLYSDDIALRQDFKNKKVLGGTPGKVYSDVAHAHLLKEKKLCPLKRPK